VGRLHGRNGRVYMGIASNGTAEPIAFLNNYNANFVTDTDEVTAFGDQNKIYVAGLPDSSGNFAGFYDDATVQTYTAATDGVARKFYLYPSVLNNGQYWHGNILPDFSISAGVGESVKISANWKAASNIIKVG
jgi:hypothetical protein